MSETRWTWKDITLPRIQDVVLAFLFSHKNQHLQKRRLPADIQTRRDSLFLIVAHNEIGKEHNPTTWKLTYIQRKSDTLWHITRWTAELVSQILTIQGGNTCLKHVLISMSEKKTLHQRRRCMKELPKETGHTGVLFYSIFHFPLLASAAMLQKCMGSTRLNAFTSSHQL